MHHCIPRDILPLHQLVQIKVPAKLTICDYNSGHTQERQNQSSHGFWKAMEIDNAIFQNLESFGKEKLFKMAMEKFWIFAWANSKIS